jgi:phosphoribosyl-dephospho-CoA transferase
MFHCETQSVRTHDLSEIDANVFIAGNASAPAWVEEALRKTPFVVVRRGRTTDEEIPIGVRGAERNQRWAAFCHPTWLKSILTPPQLLTGTIPALRVDAVPALRALQVLKDRWIDLDHPWGPGGSVGFELATGRHVVKPESDLDVVIYAEGKITREQATSLQARTTNLLVPVDIRVETLGCGFSLTEYARGKAAGILLRTPDGLELSDDPWSYEFNKEHKGRGAGERLNVPWA